jgi:hypothetical protein
MGLAGLPIMGHNITLSSVNKSSLAVNYRPNITLSSVNRSQGGCQLIMDVITLSTLDRLQEIGN